MKAAAYKIATPPVLEPLTLDELKEHLRVSGTDEDVLIGDYLAAARGWAEEYTGRALLTQTWDVYFRAWPGLRGFELPMPPLQSVTHIKYTPEGAAQETLSASTYQVLTMTEPARVVLAYNQEWPIETLDAGLPIVVRIVCGWTTTASVPAGIRQGIRWLVGHMHEHREAVAMANVPPQQVPMTARWALDPYRIHYDW